MLRSVRTAGIPRVCVYAVNITEFSLTRSELCSIQGHKAVTPLTRFILRVAVDLFTQKHI